MAHTVEAGCFHLRRLLCLLLCAHEHFLLLEALRALDQDREHYRTIISRILHAASKRGGPTARENSHGRRMHCAFS